MQLHPAIERANILRRIAILREAKAKAIVAGNEAGARIHDFMIELNQQKLATMPETEPDTKRATNNFYDPLDAL